MHAELVYYKGISPLRALVKKQEGAPEVKLPAFHEGLNAAYQSFSKNLATNPFIEKSPFLLKNAHLILQDKTSFIQDQEGYCMPTNPDFTRDLNIMAITSGRSCDFFVLINEKHIQPMAIWLNQKYYSIHTQHNEK